MFAIRRVIVAIFTALIADSAVLAGQKDPWEGPSTPGPTKPPTGDIKEQRLNADLKLFLNAEQAAPKSVIPGGAGFCPGSETKGGCSPPRRTYFRAFGTSSATYSAARVAVGELGVSSTSALNVPVTSDPFRQTGKLMYQIGSQWYGCTASLVKKGVLLTAAHCVFNYGANSNFGFHTNFIWCPANTTSRGGVYGCYNASTPRVLPVYYVGVDTCAVAGVICNNDIATLLVLPNNNPGHPGYPGMSLGWYGYGYNGYSYKNTSFLNNVNTVHITQLGYPKAFDSGFQMERNDALGWYYEADNLRNTQMGSPLSGGASGGPWFVNFGSAPTVGPGATLGSEIAFVIVGVTSYGSTDVEYNRLGSSFFGQNHEYPDSDYGGYGAGNIGKLMFDTCRAHSAEC